MLNSLITKSHSASSVSHIGRVDMAEVLSKFHLALSSPENERNRQAVIVALQNLNNQPKIDIPAECVKDSVTPIDQLRKLYFAINNATSSNSGNISAQKHDGNAEENKDNCATIASAPETVEVAASKRVNKKKKKAAETSNIALHVASDVTPSLIGLNKNELFSLFRSIDTKSSQLSVKEFNDNGGIELCILMLNTKNGALLNSRSLQDFFECQVKTKGVKGGSNEDSNGSHISIATEIFRVLSLCIADDNIWHTFLATSVAVSIVDFCYFLLLGFDAWIESAILELRQQQVSKKDIKKKQQKDTSAKSPHGNSSSYDDAGSKRSVSSSRNSTGSSKNKMNAPFPSPSHSSAYGVGTMWKPLDIDEKDVLIWKEDFKILPQILHIISQICKRIIYVSGDANETKSELAWLWYLSSSGLTATLSKVLNQVQSITASCEYDDILRAFIGGSAVLLSAYTTCIR